MCRQPSQGDPRPEKLVEVHPVWVSKPLPQDTPQIFNLGQKYPPVPPPPSHFDLSCLAKCQLETKDLENYNVLAVRHPLILKDITTPVSNAPLFPTAKNSFVDQSAGLTE